MKRPHQSSQEDLTKTTTTKPSGADLLLRQSNCKHDWEWDGQTLTAVRWTCRKCKKTELR
jgi:hypothetical protein